MRKLATLAEIATVRTHPNADSLDLAEGKSRLNDCEREGLVFLPVHEEHHPRFGRVAFKAISNKFLLKSE